MFLTILFILLRFANFLAKHHLQAKMLRFFRYYRENRFIPYLFLFPKNTLCLILYKNQRSYLEL